MLRNDIIVDLDCIRVGISNIPLSTYIVLIHVLRVFIARFENMEMAKKYFGNLLARAVDLR